MMSADQITAFKAGGGFTPQGVSLLLVSTVFAVLLLWSVWALHVAWIGWAERSINARQFFAVLVRVALLYLALTALLLSQG